MSCPVHSGLKEIGNDRLSVSDLPTSLPSFSPTLGYPTIAALLDMAGLLPGLLTTREENITDEAGRWLDCSKWPDLLLSGRDGVTVDCHRAVLLPLSRILQEILASTPDIFSQEVTTVCLPVPGVELAKLVKLIYKGSLVTSQLREFQTALTLLGKNTITP